MIHKLLTLIILLSPLSYAENINITIPSTSIPQGISLERYNQLHLAYQRKAFAEKAGTHVEVAAKAKTVIDEDRSEKVRSDAQKVNAKAEAAAKARAERDAYQAKALVEQKVREDAANKKAEARKIASSAKRDFESKIINAWKIPDGFTEKKATAHIPLSNNGDVLSIVVATTEPQLRAGIEQAVRSAAPYPMPSDPEARSQARSFTASFTVK
ncbi:hypothetical protein AMD27_10615 [Acinetobacter sp. TGL-Y2]|uniref:cell envelope integrity protein TolA n=1 Tax=Acinetobacter sp. TGL-Y2 TaxID=1407071 RepID=UPI0007A66C45|nr:cell envelope integrity protein TolA [Acinetobacter sp. TGL-Y2]AMW79303.1 hypothetical protein AMD27_10615 [Acinetobacter sp. TGL-Y2]